jgi:hypothetical protein
MSMSGRYNPNDSIRASNWEVSGYILSWSSHHPGHQYSVLTRWGPQKRRSIFIIPSMHPPCILSSVNVALLLIRGPIAGLPRHDNQWLLFLPTIYSRLMIYLRHVKLLMSSYSDDLLMLHEEDSIHSIIHSHWLHHIVIGYLTSFMQIQDGYRQNLSSGRNW